MRAYFFTNTWLSGLQKGLQSAHCVAEMATHYMAISEESRISEPEARDDYEHWAKNHKTIIILDGGAHGDLKEIAEFFESEDNPYPSASFCEDEYSLNGSMTSVGIVLPEEFYEFAKNLREGEYSQENAEHKFDAFHLRLLEILNSCPLAR